MIKIELIDPKEFTAPLAGNSVHLLGQPTDLTRDLYFNFLVTAEPTGARGANDLVKPNVTWTWRQGGKTVLHAQTDSPRQIEIPVGESRLSYIGFSPRIDTKALPDGDYQVTAVLRDGNIPLASETRNLRIENTALHDLDAAAPVEPAALTKRMANVEKVTLENRNKLARQEAGLRIIKDAIKSLVADPVLAAKLDEIIPDIRP